jgi:hypothetical protein
MFPVLNAIAGWIGTISDPIEGWKVYLEFVATGIDLRQALVTTPLQAASNSCWNELITVSPTDFTEAISVKKGELK